MKSPDWHEEPISKRHNRDAFDCGDAALNDFLRKHARQSHDRGAAKTFVAVPDADNARVLGYYTLAPACLAFDRTPESIRKGFARHDVPVFRLARLAVDLAHQSQGLGARLIFAAGLRCILAAKEVGGVALLIDAKNDAVAKWYSKFGAVALNDNPLTLLLPLSSIEATLVRAGHEL
jgi:GNAT superfamily N-acetyltransferase